MLVGSLVKVLPPFGEAGSNEYAIISIEITEDGQTVYYLDGVFGAFSDIHLEAS